MVARSRWFYGRHIKAGNRKVDIARLFVELKKAENGKWGAAVSYSEFHATTDPVAWQPLFSLGPNYPGKRSCKKVVDAILEQQFKLPSP